tara:strand:- start:535 stop:861 length:327 start_codon:yes stop_codon:yes gene_type:complete
MTKIYDLSRIKKTYPLLREKPIYKQLCDSDGTVSSGIDAEVEILNFDNTHTGSYTFKKTYTSIPIIAATAADENVNVFVTSLNLTSVTIESSAEFTGKVHIQVFKDDE